MTKKINKGQIIIDVEDNGEMIINQSGFDADNILLVLDWALSLAYIQMQKKDNKLTRKELVDGLIDSYNSAIKQNNKLDKEDEDGSNKD